jgi:hypothetical protein
MYLVFLTIIRFSEGGRIVEQLFKDWSLFFFFFSFFLPSNGPPMTNLFATLLFNYLKQERKNICQIIAVTM